MMNPIRLKHLVMVAVLGALGACGKSTPPATSDATPPAASGATADELAARELALREAEIAQREAELASRQAALAEAEAARKKPAAATKPPAPKPVVNNPPPKATPASPPPAAAAPPLVVPAGTQIPLALAAELSSKSAKVGDTIRANVTTDIRVDGRLAIPAGTTIAGQVTDVVSGSDKIGGVPKLGLRFERLEMPGGRDIPVSGDITQSGKSDTARDTAKIVGGAAAGAILGHQVKGGDKGKVIGGLLGGAIGAVAAQKTGTEVKLEAGTPLTISLAAPVEIAQR
jgi:hypothetical protein